MDFNGLWAQKGGSKVTFLEWTFLGGPGAGWAAPNNNSSSGTPFLVQPNVCFLWGLASTKVQKLADFEINKKYTFWNFKSIDFNGLWAYKGGSTSRPFGMDLFGGTRAWLGRSQ